MLKIVLGGRGVGLVVPIQVPMTWMLEEKTTALMTKSTPPHTSTHGSELPPAKNRGVRLGRPNFDLKSFLKEIKLTGIIGLKALFISSGQKKAKLRNGNNFVLS